MLLFRGQEKGEHVALTIVNLAVGRDMCSYSCRSMSTLFFTPLGLEITFEEPYFCDGQGTEVEGILIYFESSSSALIIGIIR